MSNDHAALVALRAAHDELWQTYGDTPRLRPLFEQIEAAIAALSPSAPAGEPFPDTELRELVAAVEALRRYGLWCPPGQRASMEPHKYGEWLSRYAVLDLLRARQEGR